MRPASHIRYSDTMPHIHTKPGQHDHTISIYLFRMDFAEPNVLLHYHHKMKCFAQFGGHIELNENPWQAAAHELEEETGYTLDKVKVLQPQKRITHISRAILHPNPVAQVTMTYPGKEAHFHTDSVYAFVANQEPAQPPHEGESTNLKLFTRTELLKPEAAIVNDITRDIALHIFDECLNQWETVPSATFSLKNV